MTYSKMNDLVAQAQARLISQFQNKPKIAGFLSAFSQQVQDLENAVWQLNTERALPIAVGAQLDGLGSIVGIKRLGRDDETYRAAIKGQIGVNTTNATPEDVISNFKFMTNSDFVYLIEYPIADIEIWADNDFTSETFVGDEPTSLEVIQMYAQLDKILPAGVRCIMIGVFDTEEGSFTLDGQLESQGLSDVNFPDVGGTLGKLLPLSLYFSLRNNSIYTAGLGSLIDPHVGGVLKGL
jgi:hypothetical protein